MAWREVERLPQRQKVARTKMETSEREKDARKRRQEEVSCT